VLEGAAARAPLGATVTIYLNESEPTEAVSVPLGQLMMRDGARSVVPRSPILVRIASIVKFVRFDGEHAIVSGELNRRLDHRRRRHFLHEGQRVQVREGAHNMARFNCPRLLSANGRSPLPDRRNYSLGCVRLLTPRSCRGPAFVIKTLTSVPYAWSDSPGNARPRGPSPSRNGYRNCAGTIGSRRSRGPDSL